MSKLFNQSKLLCTYNVGNNFVLRIMPTSTTMLSAYLEAAGMAGGIPAPGGAGTPAGRWAWGTRTRRGPRGGTRRAGGTAAPRGTAQVGGIRR